MMPGERIAGRGGARRRSWPVTSPTAGRWSGARHRRPLETRAREARELERQKAWRDQAARALQTLKADEGTAPINADALEEDDDLDALPLGRRGGSHGETVLVPGGSPLPTLRVLPQGISRKRLEQAVRDLGLPVVIARDVDEADVVMTLKNEYKQKTPLLREAEERAMPIYVLKSNTDPADADEPDLDLLARDRSARGGDARDRGRHRRRAVVVRAGRAVAAERVHPAAPAPDGGAGEPRLAVASAGSRTGECGCIRTPATAVPAQRRLQRHRQTCRP